MSLIKFTDQENQVVQDILVKNRISWHGLPDTAYAIQEIMKILSNYSDMNILYIKGRLDSIIYTLGELEQIGDDGIRRSQLQMLYSQLNNLFAMN